MPSPALAARILTAVVTAAIAFPVAGSGQSSETAGAATLTLPAGWSRLQVGGADVAAFRPAAGAAVLYVAPGQAVTGSFAAWFDAQWRELLRPYGGVAASPVSETRGRDGLARRIGAASMEDGSGGYLYVVFCAVRDGAWVQPLLFAARDHATYSATTDALQRVLNSVRPLPPDRRPPTRRVVITDVLREAVALTAQPAQPAAVAPPVIPPPEPPRPAEGALDGLFVGLSLADLRERVYLRPSAEEEFVAFFPDGTFIWQLPQEGFDGLDRRRFARDYPGASGSFLLRGGEVVLRFNSGEDVVGERVENGGLLVPGRARFVPVAKLDGHVLDGTYRTAWSGTVSFRPDGFFQDGGAIGEIGLAAPDGSPLAVVKGSGTYRLAANSVVLRYTGGPELRVAVYILPTGWGGTRPTALYLNRARLERVGSAP